MLALSACRSAPRAVPPPATAMPEAPPPAEASTVIRAVPAPVMPRCHASDPLAVATLTPGLPATVALARRADGALVAFRTDPQRDGHPVIRLLALDRTGAPVPADGGGVRGPVTLPDAGDAPSLPALVATADGYAIAWRSGAPGQHHVHVRMLGADGVPTAAATVLAPHGWLGAPALAMHDGHPVVAVARADHGGPDAGRSDTAAWASAIDRVDGDGSVHTAPAPEGGAYTGEAPSFASGALWATVARAAGATSDERALVRLDDDRPTLVARDLDHPSFATLADGRTVVAWRARVAQRDTAARYAVLGPGDAVVDAPRTLATYRGTDGLYVTLAPLGSSRLAALSLSALADDAGGSVNLSLLDDHGAYLGRAPLLTGFLLRSARFAVATASGSDEALVAADGRDVEDGSPQLILTRVGCADAENVDALDVPPPAFVQEPLPPEAPSASVTRAPAGPTDMACLAHGTGDFTPHADTTTAALAHTTSAVVVMPGSTLLLALARSAPDAPARLVAANLDPRDRLSAVRPVLASATDILAASRIAGGALAVAVYAFRGVERLDVITFRGAAATHAMLPTGLRDPAAAAIVPETGDVFVVARTDAGETVLARIPTTAGRAGTPVTLAALREGDTLLDAVRDTDRTALLLGRPDAHGPDVALTLAATYFAPGAAPRPADDPFADPLGHVADGALWHRRGNHELSVVWRAGETLRTADLDRGMLRNPRSLLSVHPRGGEVLASTRVGSRQWLALATGVAPETESPAALTFAALDHASLVGANTRLPDDASAVADRISLDGDATRFVALYPRTVAHGVAWRWVDFSCTVPGAPR